MRNKCSFGLLIFLLVIPDTVRAETVARGSFGISNTNYVTGAGYLRDLQFTFEQSLVNGIGVGLSLRKELDAEYSGYYGGLYVLYNIRRHRKFFFAINSGLEVGIPSESYTHYEHTNDEQNRLSYQRWIYAVQSGELPLTSNQSTSSRITTFNPFASLTANLRLNGWIILSGGASAHLIKFGIKEAEYDPRIGTMVTIQDEQRRMVVPRYFVSLGIRF